MEKCCNIINKQQPELILLSRLKTDAHLSENAEYKFNIILYIKCLHGCLSGKLVILSEYVTLFLGLWESMENSIIFCGNVYGE